MSTKTERLQVLIEREQRERLEREAKRRGTSVATLVREAIDVVFPTDIDVKWEAAQAILAAEPMDVGTLEELKREIEEAHVGKYANLEI